MYTIKEILSGKFITESPIERILVNKLRGQKIVFETQKKIGKYRVDILIGRLVVECDGAEFHRHDKRDRDMFLRSLGYTVKHYTGSEIFNNCFWVLRDIKNELFNMRNAVAK